LISRPTNKKNIAIKASLIHADTVYDMLVLPKLIPNSVFSRFANPVLKEEFAINNEMATQTKRMIPPICPERKKSLNACKFNSFAMC